MSTFTLGTLIAKTFVLLGDFSRVMNFTWEKGVNMYLQFYVAGNTPVWGQMVTHESEYVVYTA